MDSAALLDLLGNENRRRILRLLSQKPCYVTEISEYLGVSPKAVIDHLRKLENAGLVESRTDDSRRKYFYIARNLRLEVNVSQYGFGTKSAYPASSTLDLTTCRHLTLNVESDRDSSEEAGEELSKLVSELNRLKEVENELSLAQRWVQGRQIDTLDRLTDVLEDDTDGTATSRLYLEILGAIGDGSREPRHLARVVDAPVHIVADALETLASHGIVSRDEDGWTL